ncbi:hypothetical protein CLV41_10339 [Roseibium marinum]|uniref:Uncharacterized protein n=1 Tax=Roseibium marinum TaxID=281252 RepID=A0A2S3UX03_9HYPH|nr:hypothetical protein CLV41_10339 [Roseibium marinum]
MVNCRGVPRRCPRGFFKANVTSYPLRGGTVSGMARLGPGCFITRRQIPRVRVSGHGCILKVKAIFKDAAVKERKAIICIVLMPYALTSLLLASTGKRGNAFVQE